MKKPLKITTIIVASLLGLVLLISLLVSPIAKKYVNSHGEQLIGRTISVDNLKVNLWGGHVQIEDLAVYEDNGTDKFLNFDTLDVKVKLLKLLHREVDVRHITLANLDVKVLQNGNRFNFSSIIDHFAPKEETEEDTTSGKPWTLGFYDIRLSHWKVDYLDALRGSEWKLKDLNIMVPGVYFSGEENTDAGLTLALADGGTLSTDVRYNMESNDFDVDLGLEKFAISNAKAYLTDVMNVGQMDGLLDAALHVKGNLSDILKMKIGGNVDLKQVDIRDLSGGSVLAFDKIAVGVKELNIEENLFDLSSVEVAGLKSHFDRLPNGSNFGHFFDVKPSNPQDDEAEEKAEEPAKADSAAPPAKPMKLKVGVLDLHDAQVTYNDKTLPDPFSFPVTNISIHAENVSLAGENSARILAALPHGGHAVILWNGTLDDIKKHQHLILNIKNLQLADLSPYSVAYLGQPFTNGTFSFTSDNSINNSELNGKNKIDMYKPEVGERRKDVDSALHLPLKAALYVLKDKDGKVILDVPVSGNIDSPEFSYMKAVWKTLSNLLVKVATSPIRAIGNTLGINSDKLDFIEIDPEQFDFTSEQYYQLGQLAEVSQYDSTIEITLTQQIGSTSDEAVLRKATHRNEAVMRHLQELGCDTSRFVVTTELVDKPKKVGYAVTSLLIEE